jgi:hypothetical protein
MHTVASEVIVPVDRAFAQLRRYARPGFTGKARLPIRVRSEAALDVEFGPVEWEESQGVRNGQSVMSPSFQQVFENHSEPTERELRVQEKLAENAPRLKLRVAVTAIVGHFKDGVLNGFNLEGVG